MESLPLETLQQLRHQTEIDLRTLDQVSLVEMQLVFVRQTSGQSGVGVAHSVERRTCDQKIAGSTPGRSDRRSFFSRELTFRADSFLVSCPTPHYPQWHVKDLVILPKVRAAGYSYKCNTPLTQ